MKIAKGIVLALACLAMLLSIAPLFAQIDYQDLGTDGNGGAGGWNVTCVYNGDGAITSKTCTSGGPKVCQCP